MDENDNKHFKKMDFKIIIFSLHALSKRAALL